MLARLHAHVEARSLRSCPARHRHLDSAYSSTLSPLTIISRRIRRAHTSVHAFSFLLCYCFALHHHHPLNTHTHSLSHTHTHSLSHSLPPSLPPSLLPSLPLPLDVLIRLPHASRGRHGQERLSTQRRCNETPLQHSSECTRMRSSPRHCRTPRQAAVHFAYSSAARRGTRDLN